MIKRGLYRVVNAVVGLMNAFQSSATSVAVGLMVSKEQDHLIFRVEFKEDLTKRV